MENETLILDLLEWVSSNPNRTKGDEYMAHIMSKTQHLGRCPGCPLS